MFTPVNDVCRKGSENLTTAYGIGKRWIGRVGPASGYTKSVELYKLSLSHTEKQVQGNTMENQLTSAGRASIWR